MEDENISIRVAVVITIGQLCALRGNACVLLDMGILSTILDILDQDGSVQLHEAAARAVEKVNVILIYRCTYTRASGGRMGIRTISPRTISPGQNPPPPPPRTISPQDNIPPPPDKIPPGQYPPG